MGGSYGKIFRNGNRLFLLVLFKNVIEKYNRESLFRRIFIFGFVMFSGGLTGPDLLIEMVSPVLMAKTKDANVAAGRVNRLNPKKSHLPNNTAGGLPILDPETNRVVLKKRRRVTQNVRQERQERGASYWTRCRETLPS